MKLIYLGLLGLILLTHASCREQESLNAEVDPTFRPYLIDFIEEAALRGLNVNEPLKEVTIIFGPTQNPFWDGQCNQEEKRIIINPISWENNDAAQNRLTIFHELGHCLLGREHFNDILPNGEWQSIMRGGQPVANRSFITNFSGFRTEYYLDELFEAADNLPTWVKESFELTPRLEPKYQEVFIERTSGWNTSNGSTPVYTRGQTRLITQDEISNLNQDEVSLSGNGNYRIDLTLEILSGDNFSGLTWGQNLQEEGNYMLINSSRQIVIGSRQNNVPTIQIGSDFINPVGKNIITVQRIDNFNYGFINNKFVYRWEVSDQVTHNFGITANPAMEVRLHEMSVFVLED
ncbi:MAG: hypothetical protein RIF33_18485 [Cyclobacteriaceae bacterium]